MLRAFQRWDLFINVDASVIEKLEGSNYFLNQILKGKICITLSKVFTHNNYRKYILCIDIAKG